MERRQEDNQIRREGGRKEREREGAIQNRVQDFEEPTDGLACMLPGALSAHGDRWACPGTHTITLQSHRVSGLRGSFTASFHDALLLQNIINGEVVLIFWVKVVAVSNPLPRSYRPSPHPPSAARVMTKHPYWFPGFPCDSSTPIPMPSI